MKREKRTRGDVNELLFRRGSDVALSNCVFKEDETLSTRPTVEISNSILGQITVPSFQYKSIKFTDCVIRLLLVASDGVDIKSLMFKNCVIGGIVISRPIQPDYIKFDNCFVNQFDSVVVSKTIELSDTRFNNMCLSGAGTIVLRNCGSAKENYSELLGVGVRRANSNVKWCKKIRLVGYIQSIQIDNTLISEIEMMGANRIKFTNSEIGKIKLELPFDTNDQMRVISMFEVNGSSVNSVIDFSGYTLHRLEIGSTYPWYNYISGITLRRSPPACHYTFSSSIIDVITIIKLKNDQIESLSFENLMISRFNIHESILSEETTFENVDLTGCELSIGRSSISQMTIYSVLWPYDHQIADAGPNSKSTDSKSNYLTDRRETYRQLKVLSLKAENKIDARFFLHRELEEYYKYLSLIIFGHFGWIGKQRRFPFNILSMFYGIIFIAIPMLKVLPFISSRQTIRVGLINRYNRFGNWIILHTNSMFSKFGESLGRPIIWMLGFHTLWFILLVNSHPELGLAIDFTSGIVEREAFVNGLTMYVNLLSPVHGTELDNLFTPGKQEIPIFSIVDFFMRLTSGYFIYYFIRATRKFNMSI